MLAFLYYKNKNTGCNNEKSYHDFFCNFFGKEDRSDKGCFFVNTLIEMSPHNARIQALLEKYTAKYQNAFAIALTRAKEKGQISHSTDVDTKSNQLMLTIWGLRVIQRSGICADTKTIVEQQLKNILSA